MTKTYPFSLQIGLFFQTRNLRPDQLIGGIQTLVDEFADIVPSVIPVPDDPRLDDQAIVTFSTSRYRVQVARGRADFFVLGVGPESMDVPVERFDEKLEEFVRFFKSRFGIKRVGLILTFGLTGDTVDERLIRFVPPEISSLHTGTPFEALIKYVTRNEVCDLKSNQVTEIAKGMVNILGLDSVTGAIATLDYNTLGDEDYSTQLTAEKIVEYVRTNIVARPWETVTSLFD